MFARIQKFLGGLLGSDTQEPFVTFDDDDHRLAAAVLLIHAVNVDGVQGPEEIARLRTLLMERFGLGEDGTDALIAAADRREREATDFHDFASVVKRAYTAEGRERIVEMMWDVAAASGELHEFEDNLVNRVAEIIGLPEERRNTIRDRILSERGVDVSQPAG